MSLAAVCKAVRDTLQTTFNLTADSCEVGFDGMPKPACGEKYIAVHPLGWTCQPGDHDLHEEFTIGVTITLRMGFAPKDRWGIAVWLAETDGMEVMLRKAIKAIHHNQTVRELATTYMSYSGFYALTPLQFIRVDAKPTVQGPNWFSAPMPETDGQVAECGVSQMITFGKCQQVQNIQSAEDME